MQYLPGFPVGAFLAALESIHWHSIYLAGVFPVGALLAALESIHWHSIYLAGVFPVGAFLAALESIHCRAYLPDCGNSCWCLDFKASVEQ